MHPTSPSRRGLPFGYDEDHNYDVPSIFRPTTDAKIVAFRHDLQEELRQHLIRVSADALLRGNPVPGLAAVPIPKIDPNPFAPPRDPAAVYDDLIRSYADRYRAGTLPAPHTPEEEPSMLRTALRAIGALAPPKPTPDLMTPAIWTPAILPYGIHREMFNIAHRAEIIALARKMAEEAEVKDMSGRKN
ncbi:hypothetical protein FKP32DRAFT_1680346 [Trametes sanguinea]|nr:hypothetical protein FKP32DRAFT_1680346 [Trametes sanguinea]